MLTVGDRSQTRKVFLVADFFINKNSQDSLGLTNKKLQKLLYYSQAWSLVLFGKVLFNEPIEAWVHGPAVPRAYGVFKEYVMNDISKAVDQAKLSKLAKEESALLEDIWKIYGKYDANYLELLTHSEKPWQEARKGLEPYQASKTEITHSSMKDFYAEKLKNTSKR